MGFVYMVHDVHGGGAQFSDEPGVIEAQEAHGWRRFTTPVELDPDAPNVGTLAPVVSEPQPILSDEEVAELKGKALDAELEAAGLTKTGTADEKRARLAEHEAQLANPNPEGDSNG